MTNGVIVEAIALRSKVYALRIHGQDSLKRCKGLKKSILQSRVHFEDYYDALFGDKPLYFDFYKIAVKKHRVTTDYVRCKTMSCFDDKRFILNCR